MPPRSPAIGCHELSRGRDLEADRDRDCVLPVGAAGHLQVGRTVSQTGEGSRISVSRPVDSACSRWVRRRSRDQLDVGLRFGEGASTSGSGSRAPTVVAPGLGRGSHRRGARSDRRRAARTPGHAEPRAVHDRDHRAVEPRPPWKTSRDRCRHPARPTRIVHLTNRRDEGRGHLPATPVALHSRGDVSHSGGAAAPPGGPRSGRDPADVDPPDRRESAIGQAWEHGRAVMDHRSIDPHLCTMNRPPRRRLPCPRARVARDPRLGREPHVVERAAPRGEPQFGARGTARAMAREVS